MAVLFLPLPGVAGFVESVVFVVLVAATREQALSLSYT